jgi:hypothetical protein
VVTSKARAYYALVTRLRRAELPFSSAIPGSSLDDCDLVLTTAAEVEGFGRKGVALENLDENPGIFKGQILSRLDAERSIILVGIDPGKRTGLAVFYGQTKLALNTFDSAVDVCSRVGAFAKALPGRRVLVRIGNGNRSMAARLSDTLGRIVPEATVEVVDESGTSVGTSAMKGVQKDQAAAARIAFRKGEVSHVSSRSHGSGTRLSRGIGRPPSDPS